jgi:hypothetical protein
LLPLLWRRDQSHEDASTAVAGDFPERPVGKRLERRGMGADEELVAGAAERELVEVVEDLSRVVVELRLDNPEC